MRWAIALPSENNLRNVSGCDAISCWIWDIQCFLIYSAIYREIYCEPLACQTRLAAPTALSLICDWTNFNHWWSAGSVLRYSSVAALSISNGAAALPNPPPMTNILGFNAAAQ